MWGTSGVERQKQIPTTTEECFPEQRSHHKEAVLDTQEMEKTSSRDVSCGGRPTLRSLPSSTDFRL